MIQCDQEPAHEPVGRADPEDIAALEFCEEGHGRPGLSDIAENAASIAYPLSSEYIHKGHGAAKYLRHLLPGAVEISRPSPLAAQTTQVLKSQTFTAAAAIRGELKKCAAEGRHRLSVRALKVQLGLGGLSSRVLFAAVRDVVNGGEWWRQSRTLIDIWSDSAVTLIAAVAFHVLAVRSLGSRGDGLRPDRP